MNSLLNFTLTPDFVEMMIRFVICLAFNWFIIDRLYYQKSKRRDFYFTFLLTSIAIFFLVFFMIFGLDKLGGKTSMGIGIGLFGIFSIMRYRTDTMPVREMTYLFIIVCLSVVHAMVDVAGLTVSDIGGELLKLVVIDIVVMVAILLCEIKLKVQSTKLIQYDRPEMVKPENRKELMADLEQRTGLKITKVDVGGIDFLKDSVVLRITYDGEGINEVDGQFKVRKSQWREI